MDGPPDVATIVNGMLNHSESARKLSVFHLQSLLADPSFADAFIQGDGLPVLKEIILEGNGNVLAYALGSLTRLLELDVGWEGVSSDVLTRAVEIVVTRPAINILRNALVLLVLVVSRPLSKASSRGHSDTSSSTRNNGFKALKPMLQQHENFLDCLVEKLSSADHALCGNALQLMNALMRDSILNGGQEEWPRFIKRLQELGIISGVEALMRGEALADLAGPVLEFQSLTKVLLRRWRTVRVDTENHEHLSTLKAIYAASFPPGHRRDKKKGKEPASPEGESGNTERWRRLGFQTSDPTLDFEESGFLGLMDLTEYVRLNTDAFQKALLEQSVWPEEERCPITRVSLAVTMMLYEQFDIDSTAEEDTDLRSMAFANGNDVEQYIQPLLLRWEHMHAASVNAFIRLWRVSGATVEEFDKIEDLTKLLISKVIGTAGRKKTVEEVKVQLQHESLATVRQWQLEELDEVYDHAWGSHLKQAREQLHNEAVQFMQEQRIRCLLNGAWFPYMSTDTYDLDRVPSPFGTPASLITSWRYVQLSSSRRHLHYSSHPKKLDTRPALADVPQRLDVNNISSVVSNVTAADLPPDTSAESNSNASPRTRQNGTPRPSTTVTKLTIFGSRPTEEETVLLELHTASSVLASEWLDGLLMLLNQRPITADTNKLIDCIEGWSLKVRMLNLQWEDVDWDRVDREDEEHGEKERKVPSREGLDTDYWYEMG